MIIKAKIKEKKKVFIDTPYIKLDSFLKLADAVQTGGHAKIVINEGEVKVNGEVCLQRGKKIRQGDVVKFDNNVYEAVQKV